MHLHQPLDHQAEPAPRIGRHHAFGHDRRTRGHLLDERLGQERFLVWKCRWTVATPTSARRANSRIGTSRPSAAKATRATARSRHARGKIVLVH